MATYNNIKKIKIGDNIFNLADDKVSQTAASDNATYELLFSATADNTTRTEGAKKSNKLTFNPGTGALTINDVAYGLLPNNKQASNVSINIGAWQPKTATQYKYVWQQNWTTSDFKYNTSNTITDTADLGIWLEGSTTSNALTANMNIDGIIYAMGGFQGNLTGNVTGTASGNLPMRPNSIEFQPSNASVGNGGFLDFHFNQSTADYTSRIIESASGTLQAQSLWQITKNSNTVTIGSQNSSFCHIYNSANIPFIFNNTIATTAGDLGTTTYKWNNLYINNNIAWYLAGVSSAYKSHTLFITKTCSTSYVGIVFKYTVEHNSGDALSTTEILGYLYGETNPDNRNLWFRVGDGVKMGQNGSGIEGLYGTVGWFVRADSANEKILMPAVGSTTTSSSANLYIASGGTMYRSTGSSQKYKKDITYISNAEALYNLPVREFKYKEDYLPEEDTRYDNIVPGFIVEEMEQVYPIAVEYSMPENPDGDESDEELAEQDFHVGEPEGWNEKYIIPPMLKLIQDQKKEIDELKTEISKLKQLLLPKEEDENIN